MQTLGLPSHSGLHSLLSNEPPSQSYMNLINGWLNYINNLSSYFHSKGYRTQILNANKFNFDGKQYWIYKKPKREEATYRMKCLSSYGDSFNDSFQRKMYNFDKIKNILHSCKEEDINNYLKTNQDLHDFPRFFDYAAAYYPTIEQAKMIGIDPNIFL